MIIDLDKSAGTAADLTPNVCVVEGEPPTACCCCRGVTSPACVPLRAGPLHHAGPRRPTS